MHRARRLRLIVATLSVVVLAASHPLSAQTLPPGPGAAVLNARCVACHESDIIAGQKLSLGGWTRSVDKMVRWGATMSPQDREALLPYLAEHFGPRPAASHSSGDAGAATFTRVCTTCHDEDIIAQQRLSRTGWTRSVEKMMRWGATVSATEKDPLVDYLAARFPPR